jgi:hypothetical protein
MRDSNPFLELYLSAEATEPENFSRLFSPVILQDAPRLFHPNNALLLGSQGCGKSMLLALMKPEWRFAYHKAGVPFPVPQDRQRFISGGINIIRAGAADFSHRLYRGYGEENLSRRTMFFIDWFNYWLVEDILNGLNFIYGQSDAHPSFVEGFGVSLDQSRITEFVSILRAQDSWYGYFKNVRTLHGCIQRCRKRLLLHRRFLQRHESQVVDRTISDTCTEAGVPVARVFEALKSAEVIDKDTACFVRIDQYDTLADLIGVKGESDYSFIQAVNGMLWSREPGFNYKIGSRRHLFSTEEKRGVYGVGASLEHLRNFVIIDLEKNFQRGEHTHAKGYKPFKSFAADVFRRRMENYCDSEELSDLTLRHVLGGWALTSSKKAEIYAGKTAEQRTGILKLPSSWQVEIQEALINIARDEPLSAKLGEAWVRQRMAHKEKVGVDVIISRPWEDATWWKKERVQQACMQIASTKHQRLVWAREKDLIDLSGNNVLAFLSFCQGIWDVWQRTPEGNKVPQGHLPVIKSEYVQSQGIIDASIALFNKISEHPGIGDTLRRVVAVLAERLREGMMDDLAMSNPGAYGISLDQQELEGDTELLRLLQDADSYGVILALSHTSKYRPKRERKKYYIHPSYGPYLQLPATRTKEPDYWKVQDLRRLFEQRGLLG